MGDLGELCGVCAGMLLCCGLIACVICFWVFGGIALSDAYTYTEGCGLWLWVSTLVSLVFFPVLLVLLCAASYGVVSLRMVSLEAGAAVERTMLGCGAGCFLAVANCLPVASVVTLSLGLWDEDCVPHDSTCATFAKIMLYAQIVGLALEVLCGLVGCCVHSLCD